MGRRRLGCALAPLLAAAALLGACGGEARPRAVDEAGAWETAAPAAESFDAAALDRAAAAAVRDPNLRSLLVARHGRLVLERYAHGARRDELADLRSVTKSLVSTLVGIEIAERRIPGVRARLVRLLPYDAPAATDPRYDAVTLRHLLTMTAGLVTPLQDLAAPSPVRALLAEPLAGAPGRTFRYDDGSAHLAAAVVAEAAGMPPARLARDRLFRPLGIRAWAWPADPAGVSYGSSGLALRPRDLLKLGQLFLQRGSWGGRQLVPAAWVREATRRQVRGGPPLGEGYGYFWWTLSTRPGAYAAVGYGGQVLAVLPREGVVVAITSGTTGQTGFSAILHAVAGAVRP